MMPAIRPRRVRTVSAIKIERFCQAIVAGKSQSDAYRVVFKPRGWKDRTVHKRASELAASGNVQGRLAELTAPIREQTEWTLKERMQELRCAGQLDPIDFVDENNMPRAMRDIPERARRAITSIEIDPEKFITKIKFDSKRGAIMDYTKLAGDMPVEKHEVMGSVTAEHLVSLIRKKEPTVING